MDVLVADILEYPDELVERRDKYCQARSKSPAEGRPGEGLEAVVWPMQDGQMLKVHRWPYTFEPELKAYQRLAEHNVFRLKGFNIPRLLDYDAELHILELSFVTPPYILDFVGANPGRKPASFNLDRIEFEFSRQFGSDWPEVRLLLEALMHLGIYYEDAHNKNIRLR